MLFTTLAGLLPLLSSVMALPTSLAVSGNTTDHGLEKRNDWCKSNMGASGSFTVQFDAYTVLYADGQKFDGQNWYGFTATCQSDDLPVTSFEVESYHPTDDVVGFPWPQYHRGIRTRVHCDVTGRPWTEANWLLVFASDGTWRSSVQEAGIVYNCYQLQI